MLRLHRRRLNMLLIGGHLLLGAWPRRIPVGSAIIADVINRRVIDDDGLVINIDRRHRAKAVYGAVIEKRSALPIAALIANAAITKAIGNAAVEADVRAPIAGVKNINSIVEAPIGRGP